MTDCDVHMLKLAAGLIITDKLLMERLVWLWQGDAAAGSAISSEAPTAGLSKQTDARSPLRSPASAVSWSLRQ